MMTPYEEVVELTEQMTLIEKVRLLEHLSSSVKKNMELEAYRQMPWQEFLDATYGSLADDPIERDQPLEADVRDLIE